MTESTTETKTKSETAAASTTDSPTADAAFDPARRAIG